MVLVTGQVVRTGGVVAPLPLLNVGASLHRVLEWMQGRGWVACLMGRGVLRRVGGINARYRLPCGTVWVWDRASWRHYCRRVQRRGPPRTWWRWWRCPTLLWARWVQITGVGRDFVTLRMMGHEGGGLRSCSVRECSAWDRWWKAIGWLRQLAIACWEVSWWWRCTCPWLGGALVR